MTTNPHKPNFTLGPHGQSRIHSQHTLARSLLSQPIPAPPVPAPAPAPGKAPPPMFVVIWLFVWLVNGTPTLVKWNDWLVSLAVCTLISILSLPWLARQR